MVGIPGKSKGCITCRRRKIRCDQQQPDCAKCIKSGRNCEGYAKFPTFLNQTVNGPEKRHGLEEAKPRQLLSTTSTSAASSRAVSPSQYLTLPRKPSSTDIYDVQLIAQFWEGWVPITNGSQGEWECLWLSQAISIQNPTESLQLSIKALAFTRLGWVKHDTALATRGSMLYGHALRELQRALWDEQTMWLDETLAAAYALSIYELFETTTSSIKGWNSHLSGLGHLVRLRGPSRHQTPLGRGVLEAFRFSSMIQSIQFRKKSFLLEPEWRESPWENNAKDFSQRLYDYGFELGALQNQMDDAGLQRGELPMENVQLFMGSLKKIQGEIDTWYQEYISMSPSPLHWVSTTTYSTLMEQEEAGASPFPGPFTFPTLRHATATTTYWALKIAILGTFRQLSHEITRSSQSPSPPLPSPSPPQLPRESSPAPNPCHLEQQPAQSLFTFTQPATYFHSDSSEPPLLTRPLPLRPPSSTLTNLDNGNSNQTHDDNTTNNPITLATNIVRAMPFTLSDSQGILGAQQSLFALRVALFILRLQPGKELTWCQNFYRILHSRKGLRYATEIAKVDGGHGTRGNERREGVTPARTPPPRDEEDLGPYYTVAQAK